MATAGAAIASGMLAAEATTVAAAMRPSMATGPTAVVVITDMATAVADRTVVVDMATVVVDMATVVADMLVAVMLLVAAVVVAAMLAVAAVMLAVAAVMLAVAAAAMLGAAAMDMVVTADTSKRQPPSQSAHYARSGGASQLRRFAFASLFYRSSSSSMVLKSVFSSRYLTITGA